MNSNELMKIEVGEWVIGRSYSRYSSGSKVMVAQVTRRTPKQVIIEVNRREIRINAKTGREVGYDRIWTICDNPYEVIEQQRKASDEAAARLRAAEEAKNVRRNAVVAANANLAEQIVDINPALELKTVGFTNRRGEVGTIVVQVSKETRIDWDGRKLGEEAQEREGVSLQINAYYRSQYDNVTNSSTSAFGWDLVETLIDVIATHFWDR